MAGIYGTCTIRHDMCVSNPCTYSINDKSTRKKEKSERPFNLVVTATVPYLRLSFLFSWQQKIIL